MRQAVQERSRTATSLLTTVPMFRKTVTFLSIVGLLLSAGLWGLSYYGILCRHDKYPASTTLLLLTGYAEVTWHELPSASEHYSFYGHYSQRSRWDLAHGATVRPLSEVMSILGKDTWFPTWHSGGLSGETMTTVVLPLWITSAFFGVIFVFSYLAPRLRRRTRERRGLCLECGYDLRGSTDKCPECGTGFEHGDE